MANVYSPESLGIKPPPGGFKQGSWIQSRQYWNGTFSDVNTIHPQSDQIGAGQPVGAEVRAQSAAQQGVSPQQFESYLQQQRQAGANIAPVAPVSPPTQAPSAPSAPSGPTGPGASFTAPQVPNIPDIYKGLYESAGISGKESQLTQREAQYLEAKNKISDNPFLDASTMDKRLARLKGIYEQETLPLRNEIATKKADVETQLNLRLKQFDIESQVAKDAQNQLTNLIQLGALDTASGESIAQFTRNTGIPSDLIYSAINARKEKNVETAIKEFDDGTNQGFVVINSRTGEIINKQNVAASKPIRTGALTPTKNTQAQFLSDAEGAIGQGDIFPRLVQQYAPVLSLQDIYQMYLFSAPGQQFGPPIEDATKIRNLYNKSGGKDNTGSIQNPFE